MTYCTPSVVSLLKCATARATSAAIWLSDALLIALVPPSTQVPLRTPVGDSVWWPAVPQLTVPVATPSQYCRVDFDQASLPTWLKKSSWRAAAPVGSRVGVVDPPPHCEPQ